MKLNDFLNTIFGSKKSINEFNQLQEWKNAGELNAQALQEMSDLHIASSDLGDYKSYDVEAALASTMAKVDDSKNAIRNVFRLVAALIAGLLIAYLLYNQFSSDKTHQIIATDQQETYQRVDGSEFLINSGSVLQINEKENQYVLDGEAFFEVAKQPKPIVISTFHGDITVLGTSFNVRTNKSFTEIYMFDGIISYQNNADVNSVKVSKGQVIRANSAGNKIMEDLSEQAYSYWRTKTLKYSNTPLSIVIDDLNKIFQRDLSTDEQYESININTSFVNNTYDQIIDELQVITGLTIK